MEQSYLYDMIERADLALGAHKLIHHPAGYTNQKHISDFDVLYTLSGKHNFLINGREYVCDPGDVLLLAPNTILSVRCDEPADQYYCHFTMKVQNEHELTGVFEEHRLPQTCKGLAAVYRELFSREEQTEYFDTAAVRMIFKLFIIELLRENPNCKISFGSASKQEMPADLFDILYYIQDHLTESLTVESIAERAGFHPSYFSRYFKRYMGITPVRYINEHKMDLAKHFVSTTDKPIKEIAALLGYPDQFMFSKKFRERFGVSPTEFRKIKI